MHDEKSRMTSASLIAGVQAGQEDAWIRMTCLFGPLVHKWIGSMTRWGVQGHDISDISQDVFLVATQKIKTYRHSREKHGSFRGWLYGITRNKVLQFRESHPNHLVQLSDLSQFIQWDPESLVDDFEGDGELWKLDMGRTHEAVAKVRAKSEDHTWQAFWRTVIHGEETADVAQDLGMLPKNVRQARHRTIQRLREEIERLEATADSS